MLRGRDGIDERFADYVRQRDLHPAGDESMTSGGQAN
jgi:hypothetical protein